MLLDLARYVPYRRPFHIQHFSYRFLSTYCGNRTLWRTRKKLDRTHRTLKNRNKPLITIYFSLLSMALCKRQRPWGQNGIQKKKKKLQQKIQVKQIEQYYAVIKHMTNSSFILVYQHQPQYPIGVWMEVLLEGNRRRKNRFSGPHISITADVSQQ